LDSTLVYIDNDIILKLCTCGLFWEPIAALEFAKDNLRILDSAQFVFMGNRKVKRQYDPIDLAIREKAIALVTTLKTVAASASNPLLGLDCPGLDQGEAILIGEAITQPSFYFMSGDKTCFRALWKYKELAEVREKLCGRVICLEQLIRFLIEAQGFETVRDRVVPVRECDQVLKAIFGSREESKRENSLATLAGYLEELDRDCPGLLAPIGLP
jgi:hypothetical protein